MSEIGTLISTRIRKEPTVHGYATQFQQGANGPNELKSLIVRVTRKQRERISTVFSRDGLRLRQERNRRYEFTMNKPVVTFVKSRSRIQNQTEVTAVNHNGELGWISSGSTWTNCTERGNKRNQTTLESVLEQSIQLKPS